MSKTRGAERLGPFEEEEMAEHTLVGNGVSHAHAVSTPPDIEMEGKEQDIIVTTGITTRTESTGGSSKEPSMEA